MSKKKKKEMSELESLIELDTIFSLAILNNDIKIREEFPTLTHNWKSNSVSFIITDMGLYKEDFSWDNISEDLKDEFLNAISREATDYLKCSIDRMKISISDMIFWMWSYITTSKKDQADNVDLYAENIVKAFNSSFMFISESNFELSQFIEDDYRDALKSVFTDEHMKIKNKGGLIKFIKDNNLETFKGFLEYGEWCSNNIKEFIWKYATKKTKRELKKYPLPLIITIIGDKCYG